MNLFIYDEYLKKYQKTVTGIEININKLHLNGKTIRLENIKNLSGILKDEIRNGATTIIAVGNHNTLHQTINAAIEKDQKLSSELTFALIPVGKNIELAKSLGIPDEKEACNIILSRRIKKIDLPIVNNIFFLSNVKIPNNNLEIIINNDYSVSPLKKGQTEVINLGNCSAKNILANPQDGILDLYIKNKREDSHLIAQTIEINTEKESLIDDYITIKGNFKIKSSNIQINLIVGKDRYFN